MTVRVGELVRGSVSVGAVDPPVPEAGLLARRHTPVERLRTPRPQRDVADAGLLGLGQLQAVAQVIAPAAQVHGLALARLLLHSEDVDEELQALVRLRREELGMADPRDVV